MSKSRREFLEEFVDHEYDVPENWTIESLTVVEGKRLAKNGLTARFAADVPRRLGADASGPELSADKKLSKRIAYVYLSLWTRFIHSPHAPLPPEECPGDLLPPRNWKSMYVMASSIDEVKANGSVVNWDAWWDDLRPRLVARRMVMASFALDRGMPGWGYRMVSSISDEIDWVDEKFAAHKRTLNRRVKV